MLKKIVISIIILEVYMQFCKNCVMPDTRPGITFNEEGICIACQHE